LAVRPVQAARREKEATCCWYWTPKGELAICLRGKKARSGCPDEYKGWPLTGVAVGVSDCKECW
jgi:hypothetical protein